MLTSELSDATTSLTALGPRRVWSILVTIFGDLAQNDGDVIQGAVLSALMTDMGIKPEATRVALHRLRNDDWIKSIKHGRTSHYCLTTQGRKQSAAASPRIYAQPVDIPDRWQVVISETNSTHSRKSMEQTGIVQLFPRVFIVSEEVVPPPDALVLEPKSVPSWISTQIEPVELQQNYTALYFALQDLKAALATSGALTLRNTAVLRCVVVHSWRRLVLRHPELPRSLFSKSWRGHDCRVLVNDILEQLPKPDLGQILLD